MGPDDCHARRSHAARGSLVRCPDGQYARLKQRRAMAIAMKVRAAIAVIALQSRKG
jgi:hypothetical protein